MIERKELVIAGKILKPHGIKGELTVCPDNPFVDISEIPYIVCCMEGIHVPFFVENVRSKGNTTFIIKLENINSEEKAKSVSGLDFFCSKDLLEESQKGNEHAVFSWRELIGYQVEDAALGNIGEITDVDDSTQNILFCITSVSGEEVLVPANQDFIVDLQSEEMKIILNLPEGLTDL